MQGAVGLPAGQHTITATYLGDVDFAQSTATPLSLPVAQATMSTSLASSADGQSSVPFGQPVVFMATVTATSGGGIPAGFVTFADTSTSPATVLGKAYVTWTQTAARNSGVASFVDSNLPVGTHTIVAYYQGNQNYLASDSTANPDTVTVGDSATDTLVSAYPNQVVVGTPVTLAALVLPAGFQPVPQAVLNVRPGTNPVMPPIFNAPTGTVQFLDNGADLGSPVQLVDGQAQLIVPSNDGTIAALPVGTDVITATYFPDLASTYLGSTSQPFNEVILAAPPPAPVATVTTVTPKQQSIPAGSEASFTITVVPATGNTGTVPGSDTVTMYDAPIGYTRGSLPPVVLLGTATYNSTNLDWTFTTTTPLTPGVPHDCRRIRRRRQLPVQPGASRRAGDTPQSPVATVTTGGAEAAADRGGQRGQLHHHGRPRDQRHGDERRGTVPAATRS